MLLPHYVGLSAEMKLPLKKLAHVPLILGWVKNEENVKVDGTTIVMHGPFKQMVMWRVESSERWRKDLVAEKLPADGAVESTNRPRQPEAGKDRKSGATRGTSIVPKRTTAAASQPSIPIPKRAKSDPKILYTEQEQRLVRISDIEAGAPRIRYDHQSYWNQVSLAYIAWKHKKDRRPIVIKDPQYAGSRDIRVEVVQPDLVRIGVFAQSCVLKTPRIRS